MKKNKETKQAIYYDKKTDVLWFLLKSGLEEEHREIAPGVSIELGKKGELLGIEILDASKILQGIMNNRNEYPMDYSSVRGLALGDKEISSKPLTKKR